MSYKKIEKTTGDFTQINEKSLKFINYSQKFYSHIKSTFQVRPSNFDIVNLKIKSPEGKIPIRIYYPKTMVKYKENPCIMFIHGGGFVMGNLDTHENICMKLAKESQRVVISVDYRLAPKHIYPLAIRDCYCAYYYIAKNHKALKIDMDNIVLCGTSAGGNLALAVMEMCLRRRKRGVLPKAIALMYPVTDIESILIEDYPKSVLENMYEPRLSLENMSAMLKYYIPYFNESAETEYSQFLGNPYISPVKSELIFQYPKTIIVSAGKDILRDENSIFASTLAQNAVEFEHHEFKNMNHAFMSFDSKDTDKAIELISDFIDF